MAIGGPDFARSAEFIDLVEACPVLVRLLDTLDAYPFPDTYVVAGGRRAGHIRAGDIDVCAPFGLDDLLDMVLRPNKAQITEEIYVQKCARWSACWPELTVRGWNS